MNLSSDYKEFWHCVNKKEILVNKANNDFEININHTWSISGIDFDHSHGDEKDPEIGPHFHFGWVF